MRDQFDPLTWRPLTSEDAKVSADLLNAVETVDRIGENYGEEDTLQELIDPCADLERASLAAFDGDVMVGWANGTPVGVVVTMHWEADTVATGIRDARLMLIGALHEYRRQGVASALIGLALRAAVDQGYDRASVDSASPTGAFGIFERAGFTPTMRYVRWALEV